MTKSEIKQRLHANWEVLKKHKVRFVALFGSHVRNEQKEASDVDLLVDFCEGATLFDFIELEEELSHLLGKRVNVVSRRGLNKYIGPYILGEAEPIG
jgi:predicted nucleotidyltransferase